MPTRMFCDLCDNQIEDGDEFYSNELSHRNTNEYDYSGGKFDYQSEGKNYPRSMPIPSSHSMICKQCAIEIATLLLKLTKSG